MRTGASPNLADSLQHPCLDTITKCNIVNHLWDQNALPRLSEDGESTSGPYFAYYAMQSNLALHDGGRHISARTHQDIVDIVQYIKEPLDRNSIKGKLRGKLIHSKLTNEDELLDGSIDLAARLFVMTEFGDLPYAFSGQKPLAWTAGTLQDFLKDYFGAPPVLCSDHVKLQKLFNAWNLGRIAGKKVRWTTNLADHLRMVDEDKRVAIFHHASFLEYHKKSSVFPDGFLEETLRTLALLFPESDNDIQKWIQKLPPSLNVDSKVRQCGYLRADDRQIENFKFWRDRLVILKQVFDEAEPSTLSQWWCDRRKGVQWYTFWVAALVLALTIFFGVVQCVEGALQTYKAFVPPTR